MHGPEDDDRPDWDGDWRGEQAMQVMVDFIELGSHSPFRSWDEKTSDEIIADIAAAVEPFHFHVWVPDAKTMISTCARCDATQTDEQMVRGMRA